MYWKSATAFAIVFWIVLISRTEQSSCVRDPCEECMENQIHYEGSNLEGFLTKVSSVEQCWHYCYELRYEGCLSFTFFNLTGHCAAKTSTLSTVVRVDDPYAVSAYLDCKRGAGVPTTKTTATTTTTATTAKHFVRKTDTPRRNTVGGCKSPDPHYCAQYGRKKNHYCQQAWVRKYCKNLCGICGGVVPRRGIVVRSTAVPRREHMGCTSPDHQYCERYRRKRNHYCRQTWLKNNCKNLCGLCGGSPIRPTIAVRITRVTNPKRRPSDCPSSDPQYCDKYRRKKNFYCQQIWVQTRCKNLCGACGNSLRPTWRPMITRRRPTQREYISPEYITIDSRESYDSRATRKLFDSGLSDAEICVEDGNRYRRKHAHTKDLTYDPSLEAEARRYAKRLFPRVFNAYLRTGWRQTLPVVHDPANRRNRWGENILIMSLDWKGKKEVGDLLYYCRKSNELWYDEIRDYDWRRGGSRNGAKIGHYTQMVWRNTQRVGYAVVTRRNPYKRGRNEIFALLVAKYQRPGNIRGQIIKNVGRVVK